MERCIARLKNFGIMKSINHHMYPYFDKLIIVLAYLVNNMPPLIADVSERETLPDTESNIEQLIDTISSMDVRNEGIDEEEIATEDDTN